MVHVLNKMLTLTAASAMPAGSEARRILGFFMSSLANRQLAPTAGMAEMGSWTVLTPCYEEDVLYPLDSKKAAEAMGALVSFIVGAVVCSFKCRLPLCNGFLEGPPLPEYQPKSIITPTDLLPAITLRSLLQAWTPAARCSFRTW